MTTERLPQQTRTFLFDIEGRSSDSQEDIPVVISSDAIVDVADGPEILVHSPDAVDMRRAPLPIIATHKGNQVNVGVVRDIQLTDGIARGKARFGSRPEAAGYRDDVLNGIIRSVSVGYQRIKGKVRGDGVLVTSRWMPLHVAMVAEPADVNAGFFRAKDGGDFELEKSADPPDEQATSFEEEARQVRASSVLESVTANTAKGNSMSNENAAAGASADDQKVVITGGDQRANPADFERDRKTAIRNLCVAYKLDERYERSWIEDGADMRKVSEDIMKIVKERNSRDETSRTFLDLDKAQLRQYSLMRALRAAANNDWKDAGLELECNQEISKRLDRTPKSRAAFFVPLDKMMQSLPNTGRRDMTVAGSSGSNYLVGTDNQPGSFIDLLRNTSVALRMGVTKLSGLKGHVTIPKMTAGNTAYWLTDENTAITESQPTIGQLSLTPKNVAAITEVSHQLLSQSTPDAETLLMSSIARDIGLAVDVGILRGSGSSGQPTGIATTGSIGAFTGTSLAATGLLNAVADVGAANALFPGCGFVTTHAVAALLMDRPNVTSATDGTPLWQGRMEEGTIRGYAAMASGQMSSATALFGWWPSVVLAEWGVLELMINPFSDFTRGLSAVRGWYTCDVGVRYAGAWSYSSSIT